MTTFNWVCEICGFTRSMMLGSWEPECLRCHVLYELVKIHWPGTFHVMHSVAEWKLKGSSRISNHGNFIAFAVAPGYSGKL